ncbi:hypothetical protein THIOKS12320045 [Thiocapsa sp. KS1]|nr:hypothetical protein THIOKS12320045 [Thiocapsa sp. KS1]
MESLETGNWVSMKVVSVPWLNDCLRGCRLADESSVPDHDCEAASDRPDGLQIRVLPDRFIGRDEPSAVFLSSGDDDAVCWILMDIGQYRGGVEQLWRHGDALDSGFSQRGVEPNGHRERQIKNALLDKLRHFQRRDQPIQPVEHPRLQAIHVAPVAALG